MIAYLDLPSGLSGDMFLACLIDAGWSVEELRGTVARMNLGGDRVDVEAEQKMVGALRALCVRVRTSESHHHRHLKHVREIVEQADLSALVKRRAVAVFTRLAAAEAKVHGTTIEKIHFHEVGALDSIADVVGVCAGLEALGIEKLYCSALPVAQGWINSAHGQIPLPAPATLEILSAAGAPVRPGPTAPAPQTQPGAPMVFAPLQQAKPQSPVELVTPTAAALVAELAEFTQPMMILRRIGVGAGSYAFAWPNIARLWLGEEQRAGGQMVQIETNIDDMNPQLYAATMEKLLAAGAADAWLVPVQMKKGRPGVVLGVLAAASLEPAMAEILLRETTTLGVRAHEVRRHEAGREWRVVETVFGPVRLKVKLRDGRVLGWMPEYEDCRKLAEVKDVPVRQVWESALAAAGQAPLG
jgi:pyridinium-3,5-bisthiocarboxylic acid mononucleotide nickel chelatase